VAHIRTLYSFALLIAVGIVLAGTMNAYAGEESAYGWLGVRIQAVTDEAAKAAGLSAPRGVLIVGVDDSGPMKAAGIEAGDIVLSYDGRDIIRAQDLQIFTLATPPGKQVDIVVVRNGEQETKSVTVGRLAGAPPTLSSQQSGPPSSTVSAASGVAQQIGTAWARDKNCNAMPVSIILTHPPGNGKVFLVPATVTAAHERVGSSAAYCGENQQLAGKKIMYQSNPGFVGTDVVAYDVKIGSGGKFSNAVTINVH